MNQQQSPPKPQRTPVHYWWMRPLVHAALVLAAGLLVIVALGVAQRAGWISAAGPQTAEILEEGEDIYFCPMHPFVRQSTPGRCRICGMELVLEVPEGPEVGDYAVRITPAARRVANIETAPVRLVAVTRKIHAVGAIGYAESHLATIAAYVDGRVERLFADYTGVEVRQNDDLVTLYSPELFAAQTEFVQAKQMLARTSPTVSARLLETQRALIDASRQKLVELGMTDAQVQELERTGQAESRMKIFAPIAGTVIEKLVVEGQYVKAGDVIYRIADLSVVWLTLQLFPEDAASVRYGQRVEAEVQSLPGRTFTGRVAFIDPMVEERTRTVGVRVVMSNKDRQLRPGDYATARIEVPLGSTGEVYDAALAGKWISPRHPQIVRDKPGTCPICNIGLVPASELGFAKEPVPQQQSLVVPRDAVLIVGDTSIVYVETEPGRFEIRPVILGPMTETEAVIIDGVMRRENVATSGNFLIDSQMQLAGKPSLIDPARAKIKKLGPLELETVEVEAYPGQTGNDLEGLYRAYLAIQARLAADQTVTPDEAEALRSAAKAVADSKDLPEELTKLAGAVVTHAEHLDHQKLAEAREAFEPISQSLVRLAAAARGADAPQPLIHFFCPMVKGGGGDWLQAAGPLANPYYGSEMLRCGNEVRILPAPAEKPEPKQEETPQ